MENTINFGIDLGTTNSAIARFRKGEVLLFNNPLDYGRATLPSVIYFRKDKIVVGSQAKVYLEKDPKSVASSFKRKMGTSESIKIKSLNVTKTPIELSAQILKELKTFVNTSDILDSVVITIPASFDMIQSNATKEAGYQAGFKQVIILQEPIAASLAYANMKKIDDLKEGQWLVYDLGGGTFDVALIRIKDGEMKVIDHEGDNFLGGMDFDRLIVEKLIIPKLCDNYSFQNLDDDLKSASGKYNVKYYSLLRSAEEAKIRLSAVTSAEIQIDGFKDDDDNDIDTEIVISRTEFNEIIKPYIDDTIEMIKTILTRNSLTARDINFNLMVGGSTYIPYIRHRVEEILQVPINCEIDPTTAVAIGAAYYAATKPKEIDSSDKGIKSFKLSLKTSFKKASKEKEELFAAKITGNVDGLFFKIVRKDGGFDTGIKPLTHRITEDLPLVENTFNYFELTVYDKHNNVIETDIEPIGINSGFEISGQPLPNDICLEVDDLDNPGSTKLTLIFERNSILPVKRTLTFPINKSIKKGNENDRIWINVYEGPQSSLPEANKPIGVIEITGKQLSRDISKGSDIEIVIFMTESRDLTVSAYLNMSDQEFKNVFNPKTRETNIDLLKEQSFELFEKLELEIEQSTEKEDYETAGLLSKLKKEMDEIVYETENLTLDDVTDKKYQLEDRKRKVAQEIDVATKHKRVEISKENYYKIKNECENLLNEYGNNHERKSYEDIITHESAFLSTNSPIKIKEKADELFGIIIEINWRTPDFIRNVFEWLKSEQNKMNDRAKAKSLIDAGNFAVESNNWERLKEIDFDLMNLLPPNIKNSINTKIGFGL